MDATVTYTATATMGTTMITATIDNMSMLMLTVPDMVGEVTVVVTASDDAATTGIVDYDDISHTHIITVEEADATDPSAQQIRSIAEFRDDEFTSSEIIP